MLFFSELFRENVDKLVVDQEYNNDKLSLWVGRKGREDR